jgi:hypothetical protein
MIRKLGWAVAIAGALALAPTSGATAGTLSQAGTAVKPAVVKDLTDVGYRKRRYWKNRYYRKRYRHGRYYGRRYYRPRYYGYNPYYYGYPSYYYSYRPYRYWHYRRHRPRFGIYLSF